MVDDPIWQALAQMRIEPPGAALSFTRRLARENGWSRAHAEAVCHEYRRFLYLAATGAAEVTPSDQVDQAWHLHLAYTRHYWEELCARIIGRPLHHGPTAGGASEGRKYRALYAETLRLYRETFGEEPPSNIWPPSDIRFGTRYQWVDRTRHYLLPRKAVSIAGMAGGAALLAACTALAASKVSEVTRSSGTSRIFDAIVGLVILLAIAFVLASLLLFIGAYAGRAAPVAAAHAHAPIARLAAISSEPRRSRGRRPQRSTVRAERATQTSLSTAVREVRRPASGLERPKRLDDSSSEP